MTAQNDFSIVPVWNLLLSTAAAAEEETPGFSFPALSLRRDFIQLVAQENCSGVDTEKLCMMLKDISGFHNLFFLFFSLSLLRHNLVLGLCSEWLQWFFNVAILALCGENC